METQEGEDKVNTLSDEDRRRLADYQAALRKSREGEPLSAYECVLIALDWMFL